MTKGKIFTITINGIKKSYEEIINLQDTLKGLANKLDSVTSATTNLKDVFNDSNDILEVFGAKNEYLSETISRLTKITETITKVQSLSKNLLAEESIIMKGATLAKRAYTSAVLGSSNAMKIFKGALVSTGVGAFIVLIGHLVANFDSLKKELANAFGGMDKLNSVIEKAEPIISGLGNVVLKFVITPFKTAINMITTLADAFGILKEKGLSGLGEAFDRVYTGAEDHINMLVDGYNVVKSYNEGVKMAADSNKLLSKTLEEAAQKAGDTIAPFKSLQNQWNDLGHDLDKKKKFIQNNQEEFNKLGIQVSNVKDAENLFVNNSDKFIAAMKARAMATAAQELAISKYKESIAEEINGSAERSKQLQADADKLMKRANNSTIEADKLMKEGGFKNYTKNISQSGQSSEKINNKKQELNELATLEKEYLKELQKLRNEDRANEIKQNLENLNDRKKLILAQEDEISYKQEIFRQELQFEKEKTDILLEKAKKLGQDTTNIEQAWNEHKQLIEKKHNTEIETLRKAHTSTLNLLDKKHLKDSIASIQKRATEEKNELEKHYNSIQELQKKTIEKKSNGLIDTDATRKHLSQIKEALQAYAIDLDNSHNKQKIYYNEQLKLYEGDSLKQKEILKQKIDAENKFQEQNKEIQKQQTEVVKKEGNLRIDYMKSLNEKMTEIWGKASQAITDVVTITKAIFQEQLNDITERLSTTTQQYDEVVNKRKETQSKIKSLEEEAKNASGGRATVIQEQIARQMEANSELAKQEQELAKKKEKLEKDKAKKEKQQKKVELGQQLITGIANVALGVTKALAMGPIIGKILAALTAAAGAVQTGIITRQMAKLEDGGLLRGKRHAQGGMRIEGTNIEVEGDEFVVNRESTRKNLGLINYINRNRKELSPTDINSYFTNSGQTSSGNLLPTRRMYEDGGKLTNLEVIDSITAPTDDKILDAIARINFRPVVSVVDISNAQNRVTQIKDIAGA
jgi:hypothetical protein